MSMLLSINTGRGRFTSDKYQWSILSRLHISYVGDLTLPIFDNCPQLTDLGFDYNSGWHNTKSVVTLPWIPWKNLRRANFRGVGFDDIMRILRKARDLETLHSTFVPYGISHCGGSPSKDYWDGPIGLGEVARPPRKLMIHHQKLKSWTFSQKTDKWVTFAFYNMMLLRLPALKTLSIEWERSPEGDAYVRPAEATKGWECALRQFNVSLVGFRQEYLADWLKAPEMSTLRSLKLHWEHHWVVVDRELSSDLFVAMTATQGKEPVLPKLRSLVVEDTPLGFSPDVIIRMLASRWDDGADFPLKSCVVNARVSENTVWHVTEEHEAALRRWRERGYTVELGISASAAEEEDEDDEKEPTTDYMGRELIFRAV